MGRWKKWFKLVLTIFGLLLIFLMGLYYLFFVKSAVVDTKSLYLNQINVNSNTILLSGGVASAALGFNGYEMKRDNDSLYIQLRYSFVNKDHPSGNFDILINGEFDDIKKVFLLGKDDVDRKLIWSR